VTFLLDSNILVPLLRNRSQDIPDPLLNALSSAGQRSSVSVAALWEIAIKNRQGKLPLPYGRAELPLAVERLGLHLLPLSGEHCVVDVDPWPATNDPFDRLMLSVCQTERLMLLTTDAKLRDHPLAWRP
jgi:PIN domain nuclease of toxin-antitoxin system